MITRRKIVIALGAGALAPFASLAPLAGFAQQQGKVWRVGLLISGSESGTASRIEALRGGLRELGYIEGKNIVFEFRFSDGKNERLAELALELVRLKVDAIVTHTTGGVQGAKEATATIPIIIAATGDAVAEGAVASLARPGGNVTGSTILLPELMAKRIELLKEAAPRISRVGALLRPSASTPSIVRAMELTARQQKIEMQKFEVIGPQDFKNIFSAILKKRIDALVVNDDPVLFANAQAIVYFAATHRIPLAGGTGFAEAGGLIVYGTNILDLFRRAAYFIDKILKGTKPADIPVEQPTRFEFVLNMKTAKTLGLKIPNSILVQATKIIE